MNIKLGKHALELLRDRHCLSAGSGDCTLVENKPEIVNFASTRKDLENKSTQKMKKAYGRRNLST